MADDWYVERGRQRLAALRAGRAQCIADLEAAKRDGDADAADSAIANLADIDQQERNTISLYNQYAASQAPPPEPSLEERRARPIDRMDWNDIVEMTRQSKYAKNIRADDPNMIAGWQEAQRRRARGE
jgi:hypothetical protein